MQVIQRKDFKISMLFLNNIGCKIVLLTNSLLNLFIDNLLQKRKKEKI